MEVPEKSDPGRTWVPLKMQREALECGAFELFLGGAAGPGKSEYLVAAPLRWVSHAGFRAILFRNTFPELERTLIEKSWKLYPSLGAKYAGDSHTWEFPSGATIAFSYLEKAKDVYRYQGGEFSFIGFDELPHFMEGVYRYMTSRARNTDGLPIRIRATGNPDGPHLEWVKERWLPWISGEVPAGEPRWFNHKGEQVPRGTPKALSRCYIPGRLRDNPYLGEDYEAQLLALDPVLRARLLDGDWDAVYGEGKLFHRDWWRILDDAPPFIQRVRAWDFGGTRKGDYTRGVRLLDVGAAHKLLSLPRYVIDDLVTVRGPPHEVHAAVKAAAELDGKATTIIIPRDPGQAGIDQADSYKTELTGYRVIDRPPTGSKIVRAGGISTQVGAKNVGLVRRAWNAEVLVEGHAFPDGTHDDIIDAMSDAFSELTGTAPYAFTGVQSARGARPSRR